MNKRFVSLLLLVAMLMTSVVVASAGASFDISDNKAAWQSADDAIQSTNTTWNLSFTTVKNYGVGRGWCDGTTYYATDLYTYNSTYANTSTSGKTYYERAKNGKAYVIWKMRMDNDYTSTFTAKGEFNP